ncbi:TetR family transcriptional regulator [Paenibacillus hubeiensis]|uniref:TetR family transcriptional regulator n=1 Tax=Paenibacillus hubeiensis TaxID=3077330 RepID=UPI0031BB708C
MTKQKATEFLTKEQIMEATQDTVRRYGAAKSSVTDVAKRLGVSHGTIYRHYASKQELFEAVTEKWLEEEIIARLDEIVNDRELSGQGIRHVHAYIQTLVQRKRHYAETDAELFDLYAKVTEQSADIIQAHVRNMIAQIREILEKNHLFDAADSGNIAAAVLQSTARFHHPAHAYEWKQAAIEAEFGQVWNLVEKGLIQLQAERK